MAFSADGDSWVKLGIVYLFPNNQWWIVFHGFGGWVKTDNLLGTFPWHLVHSCSNLIKHQITMSSTSKTLVFLAELRFHLSTIPSFFMRWTWNSLIQVMVYLNMPKIHQIKACAIVLWVHGTFFSVALLGKFSTANELEYGDQPC